MSRGWRSGLPATSRLHLQCGNAERQLNNVNISGSSFDAAGGQLTVIHDGVLQRHAVVVRGQSLFLQWQNEWLQVKKVDPISRVDQAQQHAGGLHAPMNGSIVRLLVNTGEQVEAGAALLVVEAMKMEHTIRAPHAGTVTAIFCSEGELVSEGTLLVELEETP